MRRYLNSVALIFGATLFCLGRTPGPEEFLRAQMHLSPNQIADIQNGKAVATILSSPNPSDIFVFGAVYVRTKPVAYLQLMRDVNRFNKLSGYLGAGEFSKSPTMEDMAGLSLDHDDIKDLKNCRPGNCEVQLPEESMEAARASVNWNSPDVAEQVNDLAKRRIIRLLEDYQYNGDRALGTYRDKRDPLPVAEQFRSLLGRVELFPQYLPELNRYLLDYPDSMPDGTQDFFYWEKVNFGLKATIRLNHGVIYRAPGLERRVYVLAIKQLYATHYFQAALDLGNREATIEKEIHAELVAESSPAAGFDSYWHSQRSQKVGEQFGFTEDAWKVVQLGNFSPDCFGPVADYASRNLKSEELQAVNEYISNNPQVRGAAIYLHFDNLIGDFQHNSDFDYLFSHLLQNAQHALADYNRLHADERLRRVLTLITLGASLHAVQDFYSHSDWIHNDFNETDVKMVRLPSGELRAPTWFEFRSRHDQPDKWPFQVRSGIYPPTSGALNTRTHMNHDNSRLMFTEYENPGQPLRPQAEYHNAGPVPARGDDASDLAHQQRGNHSDGSQCRVGQED